MDYKVKETVTRENIISDIRYTYFSNIKGYILATVFLMATSTAFMYFCSKSGFYNFGIILLVSFSLCSLLTLGCAVYSIISYFLCIRNFKIVTDWLAEVTYRRYGINFQKRTSLFLRFAAHGYFAIGSYRTKLIYYRWSENYRMNCLELERSSRSDDNFFLVVFKNKIINIYNKKMFDLSSELTEKPTCDQ